MVGRCLDCSQRCSAVASPSLSQVVRARSGRPAVYGMYGAASGAALRCISQNKLLAHEKKLWAGSRTTDSWASGWSTTVVSSGLPCNLALGRYCATKSGGGGG